MHNPWFQFKQFRIEQDQCAMKVGTDGVLLGAWADLSGLYKGSSVLDIGTGTGLIALMAAQRCQARIHAIEIEMRAARQAADNFANCPWADRLHIIPGDFRRPELTGNQLFDHILSNPPFFSRSLNASDQTRSLARHDDFLSIKDLAQRIPRLLKVDGKFSVIYPADRLSEVDQTLIESGLFLRRKVSVWSQKKNRPIRIMAEWGKVGQQLQEQSFSIYDESGRGYSEAYRQLTREFYPGF